MSKHYDTASIRMLQQIETAEEGTLSGSGRTYNAYDFSSVYICADILQNLEFTE